MPAGPILHFELLCDHKAPLPGLIFVTSFPAFPFAAPINDALPCRFFLSTATRLRYQGLSLFSVSAFPFVAPINESLKLVLSATTGLRYQGLSLFSVSAFPFVAPINESLKLFLSATTGFVTLFFLLPHQ